jgi:hypothetical protein
MYIGHYKSVKSNKEFFSSVRHSLDFPTQVEYDSERYLLQTTFSVSSKSLQEKLKDRADALSIPKDINVD